MIKTTFIIPDNVLKVIQIIENDGNHAWLVGGCVRDMILGTRPHDYDIASDIACDRLHKLFEKTIDTGIAHGTVTVVYNGEAIEITHYRVDGEYSDGRHPDSITLVDNFELDLARRDFTMNAIGYNPERGLFDPFNGLDDIGKRTIRTVGDPGKRFKEDALRIMRAFRFASQLGFTIEAHTIAAAVQMAPLLQRVSAERVFSELKRTLCGNTPSMLSYLLNGGALEYLGLKSADVALLDSIPNDLYIRFAALCILCKADCTELSHKLKADKKLMRLGSDIVSAIMKQPNTTADIKRAYSSLPPDMWEDVYTAQCLLCGTEKTAQVVTDEPYLTEHLQLSAEDKRRLEKEYGGKITGELLARLTDAVIEDKTLNDTDILLGLIQQYMN